MSSVKIGVIGYSAKSFPIFEAYSKILSTLEKAIESSACYMVYRSETWEQVSKLEYQQHPGIVKHKSYPPFEIVSGLTDYGIPALVYCVTKDKSLRHFDIETVGFAPKCALNDNICKVDKQMIVGENYGDESKEFIEYIDILIKVGGGSQSIRELKMFRETKPNNLCIVKPLKAYVS